MHAQNSLTFVAALILAAACGGTDVVATSDGGASLDGSPTPTDGAPATDAAPLSDGRAAFCAGRGPAVVVPGATRDVCTGEVAERVFRYAVCACESFEPVGSFVTDSFDSDADGTITDSGGPVGTNGTFSSTSTVDIGGTLSSAGLDEVTFVGSGIRVGGDLRAGGSVRLTGEGAVARDARVVGDVAGIGSFSIARDLHQPAGSTAVGVRVGGDTITGPVSVAPPCPCGDDVLDIGAIVAATATDNHNAEVDLAPDAYTDLVSEHRITLPCGRFYLDGIGGTGGLTLEVAGRTALFVGGDVNIAGSLNVELGPEGELDVFIAGTLQGAGTLSFGDPERPAATRVYVGGAGEVSLQGTSAFVGNLYAPRAPISFTGESEIYGSVFGRRVEAAGSLGVHYDRAILEVGEDCPDTPPPTCDRCGDCPGGYTCGGDGTCGTTCESDADCCDPLTCDVPTGVCTSILI